MANDQLEFVNKRVNVWLDLYPEWSTEIVIDMVAHELQEPVYGAWLFKRATDDAGLAMLRAVERFGREVRQAFTSA